MTIMVRSSRVCWLSLPSPGHAEVTTRAGPQEHPQDWPGGGFIAADAASLAGKLAMITNGAPESLLSTYEQERRPTVPGSPPLTWPVPARRRPSWWNGREPGACSWLLRAPDCDAAIQEAHPFG